MASHPVILGGMAAFIIFFPCKSNHQILSLNLCIFEYVVIDRDYILATKAIQ